MSHPHDPNNSFERADGQPVQYPSRDWTNPAPANPPNFPPYGDGPKKRMPWYGWGCLGLAGMGTLVLIALIIAAVVMPPVDTAEPDPVETTQEAEPTPEPEPEPEPEPTPTFEALETEAPSESENDVLEEAGGDQALRNYNETFDDPAGRGDEGAYLNHLMENDRAVYMTTENETMLNMGRTVCEALDEGYSTVEILEMIPDTLTVNTQASIVAGSSMFLCDEHLAQVQREVGEASGNV